MPKRKIEKVELVRLHKDKPADEVAKATGLPMAQVYYYLRQLNASKTKVDFLPSAEELKAEGLPYDELAARYRVSKSTIAKRMRQ